MRKLAAAAVLLVALAACGPAAGSAAGAQTIWTELPAASSVPLNRPWAPELPPEVTRANLYGVVVAEAGNTTSFMPVSAEWSASCLVITPIEPYRRVTSYSLRLFLADGRRFRGSFTTERYPALETKRAQVVEIPACPDEGFNYPYLLFVPPYLNDGANHRLLVEPNNTGVSDDLDYHLAGARQLVDNSAPRNVAEALNIPLLVPVFPRPSSRTLVYTHDLNRETLLVPEGDPLCRLDLQLIAMIQDAKRLLAQNGVQIKEKIFLEGTSAGAHFTNRFALIHPELVRAVASGAINGLPTLPVSAFGGQTLRYPVGIADLKDLTGADFDLEDYRKVAQFIFMGAKDTNDTLPHADCYEPCDADLIRSVLGSPIPDRWAKSQEIYKSTGVSVQFVTYPGVGHAYGSLDDVIRFLRLNDNDREDITRIRPSAGGY